MAVNAGTGVMDQEQVTPVKAQLLGFLLYGSPASIERLLRAFGSEEMPRSGAGLQQLLPGPHPVLRSLASASAGESLMLY